MDETPPENPYTWSPHSTPAAPAAPRRTTRKREGVMGVAVALGAATLKYGFLVLKLFKFSTLFSALITYAFLVTIYGWQFALGIVALLLVHEFGHMVAATREGLPVTAPIFALLGAFVTTPVRHDARQDAYISIAGPAAGLLAAAGCGALSATATSGVSKGLFFALMSFGCLITIFNMLPIGFLDGGKIARVLPSAALYLAGAMLLGLFLLSQAGVVLIVGIVCLYIGYHRRHDAVVANAAIATTYCVLIALSGLGLTLANNAAVQNGLHY
jgi:Zn-dependent protease